MSLSTFLCMLAYYLGSFRKIITKNTWLKHLFKGKVISYEPTCLHKQCIHIWAITTVPTQYTLLVNLLTKSSHEIPIGNKKFIHAL